MEPVVIVTGYDPHREYQRMWVVRIGRERNDTVCLLQKDMDEGEIILKSGDDFFFEAAKRAVLDLQNRTFICEVVPGVHAPYTYAGLEFSLGSDFRMALACHILLQNQTDLIRKDWNLKVLREKISKIKEDLRKENFI